MAALGEETANKVIFYFDKFFCRQNINNKKQTNKKKKYLKKNT